MRENASRGDTLRILREMIQDIRIGMLTTATADGTLRSRPMATQQMKADGDLWFFTPANAAKAQGIQANTPLPEAAPALRVPAEEAVQGARP